MSQRLTPQPYQRVNETVRAVARDKTCVGEFSILRLPGCPEHDVPEGKGIGKVLVPVLRLNRMVDAMVDISKPYSPPVVTNTQQAMIAVMT